MSIRLFRRLQIWSAAALAVAAVTVNVVPRPANAAPATCPFDTGGSDAMNDGMVLTRYALGITGAPMTASTRYASLDPLQVKANIECVGCALDMNGDGIIDTVDATIIARHLAGFQGGSLTAGLALGAGSRNTPAAVASFLAIGCSMTGGTITSITAGTGLSGDTITSSGTIAADTAYLQRRLASTCGAGSFITGVAADGTVSCAWPPAGGSGTVTNIATGAGLTGGPISTTGTIGLTATQLLPTTACPFGSIPKSTGSAWVCAPDDTGPANAFVQGGNSFGAPAVIGTNDAQPLTVQSGDLTVNMLNSRGDGLRIEHRVGADITNAPATINGHRLNTVALSASGGTIAGGGYTDGNVNRLNTVTGGHGAIGGGANNSAGYYGTISGGGQNTAGFEATVAGGVGNTASGSGSTVAGGNSNVASGVSSFAAGNQAQADKNGTFVWADNSTNTPFKVTLNWVQPTYGAYTFNVRAVGGVLFATSVNAVGVPATYCYMGNVGTGWICSSDRNVKERIEPITPSRVLAGVLAMPVSTWSIIGSKVRQMGPMAQDFYRAFGLGDTDKAINSIDVGGVAFAAIQGLNERLASEVNSLRSRLAAKDAEAVKLKVRLAAIEKRLGM